MITYTKCLLALPLFLSTILVCAQNTMIPDPNFEQALIDLGLDTGTINGSVPTSNINTVEELTIDNYNITDLTGIQSFINLRFLFVQNNALSTINVSANTNLQLLWCFNNTLSSLNVSNNNALTSLRCENNNLSVLDLSTNLELVDLTCNNNTIASLDVSANTMLRTLFCGNNTLSSLDVSTNTNLFILSCESNTISTLTIASNTRLNTLNCSNNNLIELDASSNSNVLDLNCSNNQLCILNVNNGNNGILSAFNFEGNPDLNCVIVDVPNVRRTGWFPNDFSAYVDSRAACDNLVTVDVLDDVIAPSFTLPSLIQGNYFTETGGTGTMLNVGDVITTRQTIFIYNTDRCFSNESRFEVIISDAPYFVPKFFTPNNDGVNDRWKIIDNDNSVNSFSIYNRYGKLLKFFANTSQSWDGTYRNTPMPNDSYWYEIVLNNRNVVRGYFALKR